MNEPLGAAPLELLELLREPLFDAALPDAALNTPPPIAPPMSEPPTTATSIHFLAIVIALTSFLVRGWRPRLRPP
ncbi:MAG: hypothetical protein WBB74_07785 [Gaiellaceae bacterium]